MWLRGSYQLHLFVIKPSDSNFLLSCSGFGVGIYTTNSPEACQYVAENCKANVIVLENEKQLQKILQVRLERLHSKSRKKKLNI